MQILSSSMLTDVNIVSVSVNLFADDNYTYMA